MYCTSCRKKVKGSLCSILGGDEPVTGEAKDVRKEEHDFLCNQLEKGSVRRKCYHQERARKDKNLPHILCSLSSSIRSR